MPAAAQLVVASAPYALPRPSARAVLVAVGDHLLLLGGLDGAKRTTAEILRIDPAAAAVTAADALSVPVHDAAGGVVAGAPTVFGGGNATETAVVQRVGTDGKVSVIGQLPVPRSDLAAATIGARTFLVGGFDGAHLRAATIATTDGRTFQVLGDLTLPVRYAAVAALGTNVYVIGGTTTGDASGAVRTVQALDTATGVVRPIGTLPEPLTGAVAATIAGRVYVIGGILGGRRSAEVWRLHVDPAPAATVTLDPVATLPAPIANAAVAVLHGTAYLVGGESPAPVRSIITLNVR